MRRCPRFSVRLVLWLPGGPLPAVWPPSLLFAVLPCQWLSGRPLRAPGPGGQAVRLLGIASGGRIAVFTLKTRGGDGAHLDFVSGRQQVERWSDVAQRVAMGLGIEAGELVLVRDGAGRPEVLTEFLLAIEQQGATPLPECVAADYLRRLLVSAPVSSLERWDQQRMGWVQQADRIISLQGDRLDPSTVPPAALASWGNAINRLTSIDEERKLPFYVVAVPTA